MDYLIIGMVAGALTTLASVPQLLKAYRTKSTDDISMGMAIFLFCGLSLWLIYGILSEDLPLIFSNILTLLVWVAIIALKLKYDSKRRGAATL
ncbi:MAG TPA: SemiSWEET transporter [archaeon]|nr:SemiSWEET transporter [archaeon]